MQLKSGTHLQNGKYKIERVLGQGGFGITYLATQELLDRKVCIKEFFFKEYCERDETTSHVSLGTQSNHEIVERFLNKFLKEARTISQLDHPNIIHIHDIFKENNTAYYVMEYIEGESLLDRVNRYGAMSETDAIAYIKQVSQALDFIHQRSINHLDVKPANIMVRQTDNKAILIDFGLSKQYDAQGGQTSTTPVGISHGYAPMEQYNVGGVNMFSPQTDIYSLGATLYKLLTGNTPPQAAEVLNEGLPELPNKLSYGVKTAITKAMQVRKKDRPENVKDFLDMLGNNSPEKSNEETKTIESRYKKVEDESTKVLDEPVLSDNMHQPKYVDDRPKSTVTIVAEKEKKKGNKGVYIIFAIVFAVIILFLFQLNVKKTPQNSKLDEVVDLGLSVKWAANNVGASNICDGGIYYLTNSRLMAYEGGSPFRQINDADAKRLNLKLIEEDENLANLKKQGYIIPTEAHFIELLTECDWTQITLEGEEGYKVTGKNGNSIFIPMTGMIEYDYMSSRLNHVGGDCCFLVEGKTKNKNTNGWEHVEFINEANESIEFIGIENLKTIDEDYCIYLEKYEKKMCSYRNMDPCFGDDVPEVIFKPLPEIVGRNIRLVKK